MTCTSCNDLLLSIGQYELGLPVNQVATQKVGFKLVGDNIDKSIKARYVFRSDKHRNQSLHYFHPFAMKNRKDFSHLLDIHPQSCANSPHNIVLSLLPSADDDRILRKNLAF